MDILWVLLAFVAGSVSVLIYRYIHLPRQLENDIEQVVQYNEELKEANIALQKEVEELLNRVEKEARLLTIQVLKKIIVNMEQTKNQEE